MNEQAIRFRIGIFVLAALIVLGVLVVLFGGMSFSFRPTSTYTLHIARAQGVAPGTPVRRSGVKIGEVRKVSLDNDTGRVEVLIQVRDGYTLRKGDPAHDHPNSCRRRCDHLVHSSHRQGSGYLSG